MCIIFICQNFLFGNLFERFKISSDNSTEIMSLLLLKNKRKRDFETCEGDPPAKKMRFEVQRKKQGFMLILNHEYFDDSTLKRPGTKIDVKNLVSTFSKFNFKFHIVKDLNYEQVVKLVERCESKALC